MSKKDKDLERLRDKSKKWQIPFELVDKVLQRYGFQCRQRSRGSSHYIYSRGIYIITVKKGDPFVHPDAVKDVVDILDEILEP